VSEEAVVLLSDASGEEQLAGILAAAELYGPQTRQDNGLMALFKRSDPFTGRRIEGVL
jgi:hypothetical protein